MLSGMPPSRRLGTIGDTQGHAAADPLVLRTLLADARRLSRAARAARDHFSRRCAPLRGVSEVSALLSRRAGHVARASLDRVRADAGPRRTPTAAARQPFL